MEHGSYLRRYSRKCLHGIGAKTDRETVIEKGKGDHAKDSPPIAARLNPSKPLVTPPIRPAAVTAAIVARAEMASG
jgi:hypothetical protein